jgi:hypothetical protein
MHIEFQVCNVRNTFKHHCLHSFVGGCTCHSVESLKSCSWVTRQNVCYISMWLICHTAHTAKNNPQPVVSQKSKTVLRQPRTSVLSSLCSLTHTVTCNVHGFWVLSNPAAMLTE